MNGMWFTLIVLVLASALVLAAFKQHRARDRDADNRVRMRRALTPREQAMYFRLRQTFPELVVMSQVAYSSLMSAHRRRARSAFDRKVADFVVFTKAFEVLAVIQINDPKVRAMPDEEGERLLTAAGYRVLKFAEMPDVGQLLTSMPASAESKPLPDPAPQARPGTRETRT